MALFQGRRVGVFKILRPREEMLLSRQRRRVRLILQQAIYFKAWFGLLFYPISFLLLLDKMERLEYSSALSRALPGCCLGLLLPADAARYWLGTRGNLRSRVFPLTAFLLLSACPVVPALACLGLFVEHRLAFDIVACVGFAALLLVECGAGFVVLRGLLRQETAKFLQLRDCSDANINEYDESSRQMPARPWQ